MKKTAPHKMNFCYPAGFLAGFAHAGLKKQKPDVALFHSAAGPANCAAVFTKNAMKGNHIAFCRSQLAKSGNVAEAVLVASGNANAFNGRQGVLALDAIASRYSKLLGIEKNHMLVLQTGKIGIPFDSKPVLRIAKKAVSSLAAGGLGPAEAMMTTDSWPKAFALEVKLSKGAVRIGGVCKGAGMICPNMATMLALVSTDAQIRHADMREMLDGAVSKSFNSISVDNDTSPNDTVLFLANGASAVCLKKGTPDYKAFSSALGQLCTMLACEIVKNGEGATKFIEIEVSGAKTDKEAKEIARTISQSYLVKAAIFGSDPNWGRIIAAAGRAGVRTEYDLAKSTLSICGREVYAHGHSSGRKPNMSGWKIPIALDLKSGKGKWRAWASDLSYGYVEENSQYTT
ncbi:MAG: bifunctional glutamate N-acetyltransferase/amino-acid acetyltransferase ArgJ [Candidatus Micrarchaeia archaeon]